MDGADPRDFVGPVSPTSAIRIRSNFVAQGHREVFAPGQRNSLFHLQRRRRPTSPICIGPVPRRRPHGAHSAQRSCAVVVAPAKSRAGPAARSAGTERVSQLDCAPRPIRGPNLGSLSSGEFQMPGRVKCPSCLKFVGGPGGRHHAMARFYAPREQAVRCHLSPLRGRGQRERLARPACGPLKSFDTSTGGASRAQSSLTTKLPIICNVEMLLQCVTSDDFS